MASPLHTKQSQHIASLSVPPSFRVFFFSVNTLYTFEFTKRGKKRSCTIAWCDSGVRRRLRLESGVNDPAHSPPLYSVVHLFVPCTLDLQSWSVKRILPNMEIERIRSSDQQWKAIKRHFLLIATEWVPLGFLFKISDWISCGNAGDPNNWCHSRYNRKFPTSPPEVQQWFNKWARALFTSG